MTLSATGSNFQATASRFHNYCLSGLKLLPFEAETTAFPPYNYCLADMSTNGA